METETFHIRTGQGGVCNTDPLSCNFNDCKGVATRIPRQHSGWQSVTVANKRYQLHGGVRTNLFICLNNPIKGR